MPSHTEYQSCIAAERKDTHQIAHRQSPQANTTLYSLSVSHFRMTSIADLVVG